MRQHIGCILFVLMSLASLSKGIKCWTCENARNIEDCNARGKLKQCNGAQNTCGIEIRGNGGWNLKTNVKIFKFCKQDTACRNVQNQNMQNAWNLTQCNPRFPNSVCRCCCQTDNCNVGELECLGNNEVSKDGICSPAFTHLTHGQISCSSQNRIGSICTFRCDPGYYVSGHLSSTCLKSKTWSNQAPSCQPIVCPVISRINNGFFKCDKNSLFGSICSFTCENGYDLMGARTSICQENQRNSGVGQWSTKGQFCKRMECDSLPNTPENGYMTCSDGTNIESTCEFACDYGYQRVGMLYTMCAKGKGKAYWNKETPTCKRINCEKLVAPVNGNIECSDDKYLGSKCTFSCNKGYSRIGAMAAICSDRKTEGEAVWNRETPVCKRKECSTYLRTPTNGFMKCTTKKFYGSVCEFSCGDYYDVVGDVISTCAEHKTTGLMKWTSREPKCQRKQCDYMPQTPRNGKMVCSDERYYGSVCAFSCNKEYERVGTSYSMCKSSIKKQMGKGKPQWDRSEPICKKKKCSLPPNAHDYGFMVCTEGNFIGSQCEYGCDDFYRRVGHLYTTCIEDHYGYMRWSEEKAPSCERITCSALKDPKFGEMECSDDKYVNSECKFRCTEEDYILYPKAINSITCQNDTNWSEMPPCCARSCPPYAVMDMIVILDSSSSIGRKSWKIMLKFVNEIFNLFVVQRDAMNFGVVRYNKKIDTETRINLNECPDDLEMLKELVSKMPYDGTGTWTGQAISYVHEHMLKKEYGNRDNIPDVVLVITDGRAQDDVKLPSEAMRKDGVLTFALGITPTNGKLDMGQLRDIAGAESRLFLAEDGFDTLTPEFAEEISEKVCGNPCERLQH
uniref:P-selectin-like n=1 Tax=Styela clava TaxID=7725 RepID=UPI00193A1A85|nr:P-selectin-like [Styela clava]